MLQEIAIALLALFLMLALLLAYEDDQYNSRFGKMKSKAKQTIQQTSSHMRTPSASRQSPSQVPSRRPPTSGYPTSTRTAIPVPIRSSRTTTPTGTAVPWSTASPRVSTARQAQKYNEDDILKTARQNLPQQDVDDVRTARQMNRAPASGNQPGEPRSSGGRDHVLNQQWDLAPHYGERLHSPTPSDRRNRSSIGRFKRHHSRHRSKGERIRVRS